MKMKMTIAPNKRGGCSFSSLVLIAGFISLPLDLCVVHAGGSINDNNRNIRDDNVIGRVVKEEFSSRSSTIVKDVVDAVQSSNSSQVDELLDQYEKAANLGIIENGNSNDEDTSTDPISALIVESIQAAVAALGDVDSDRTIIIENEIMGNTFTHTITDGLQFSPEIAVTNDMHGSLHDNNNAVSDTGDVRRQNGVADFTNALTENNNAYSEKGNVIRQNGIVGSPHDETHRVIKEAEDETDTTESKSTVTEGEEPGKRKKNENDFNTVDEENHTKNNDNIDDIPKGAIIIRNKVINNKVMRTKQKGLIVTPRIGVTNDMSDSLHDNNNAISNSGNVARQNGVADFTGALHNNNGAFSTEGDVLRQNGVIGQDASELSGDVIHELLQSLGNLETLGADTTQMIAGVIKLGVADEGQLLKDLLGGLPGVEGVVEGGVDVPSSSLEGNVRHLRTRRSSSKEATTNMFQNAFDRFVTVLFGDESAMDESL
uniref:Uncharacterized protein n=1 Tax=Ditylum brightwellii TaxID=49249 RepID=A0A7S1YTY0_9STRA|mmetsp:Transcript_17218/g.25644  ORF Transcript_17218/g.25644 Transcript_17218/m.25644 type:complete len:487 (+) Transcript_17218:97-1557(+)